MSQNMPPDGQTPVTGTPGYGYDQSQFQSPPEQNQNYYQQQPQGQYPPQPKSKIAAGIFGVFFWEPLDAQFLPWLQRKSNRSAVDYLIDLRNWRSSVFNLGSD